MANLKNQTKEQDLIRKQEEEGNEVLYLVKVGIFFHAYNAAAYALSRVMGYRVKRRVRKSGLAVLTAGFPADKISIVVANIKAAGGHVLVDSDDWVEFSGINCTADGIQVLEDEKKVDELKGLRRLKDVSQETDLVEMIRNYDLLHSTPMDAVAFIDRLQKLVGK
jgi:hypothetical protein